MTDINTVLVFKSIDAKKQNSPNKPGHFTTKFTPELVLEENKKHYLALDHISMYASWHNIREEYKNNELKISKNKGRSYSTITFSSGVYDNDDLNKFIEKQVGKLTGKDMVLIYRLI